jgi:hypothetical protein
MMTTDPRIKAILQQILNPEDLGLASSARLRDVIRFALGRQPVESTLVAYFHSDKGETPLEAARSRLALSAINARAEYDRELQAGGEPAYPSWTDDLMTVLTHMTRQPAITLLERP